ncbi:MAG TPA: GNAT family protein [Lachnospiraceae bacterium]|nr:GNAT family protein [Lachnospiraceae bacterium]
MIRSLEEQDIMPMLEWMHDKEVNCWFAVRFADMTESDVREFIHKKEPENRHWAIVDENNEYCGTISLKDIDVKNECAEMAIVTRQKYHGRGYAYYAAIDVMKIAFHELNLHRIYLNVMAENGRANAFYNKLGMVYEGMSRQSVVKDGCYIDLKWYSILKEEFDERNMD